VAEAGWAEAGHSDLHTFEEKQKDGFHFCCLLSVLCPWIKAVGSI
jgi:hypothetical protein